MKEIMLQAHMGVASECPENTMSAFRCAVAQGYGVIELDPAYTLDGELVVLHDKTLNRTARNADGTPLDGDIFINSITLDEAMKYDLGIGFSEKYRGERLPRLDDVLDLASRTGVRLKLDNKLQSFPQDILDKLLSSIRGRERYVSITSSDIGFVRKCLSVNSELCIDYDGAVDEEVLAELSALTERDRLTVWLPLECEGTSWVKVRRADRELCELVKRYARLGIWIVTERSELERAAELEPDIIETNGVIKPIRNVGARYDMHTHSEHSHDSACPIRDMAVSEKGKGMDGFAVTDHCGLVFDSPDIFALARASVADAAVNNGTYGIEVLRGLEIGEARLDRDMANRLISSVEADVVIGSVHAVELDGELVPYSRIVFSDKSGEWIDRFLAAYLDAVLETVMTCDMDVLAHLTCPLRYICGRYGIDVDMARYGEAIRRILECVIKRGIALEVNTSCLYEGSGYPRILPTEEILGQYRAMGGHLITLGSDAHLSADAAKSFDSAVSVLRALGFEDVFCFKGRVPVQCSIR